jgi:hypothetical protein
MASKTELPTFRAKYDIADLSIAGITGLAFALVALFLCVAPRTNISGASDYIAFWATGQQLVHHANPYDGDAMMRIEHSAGHPDMYGVMLMRNPPWALPLAFPLGFIGLRVGLLLWSLALIACLIVSVRILWRMHGRPSAPLHWLGYSFLPAPLCVIMGQTSLFALLGYVLFLDLHGRRPFLAGICLWLCALKPHLFLPIGIVLLAWILVSRSYKILAGAAVAIAASCAITFWIDSAAWSDYAQMMRTTGIERDHIPCLSVALRFWLSPQTVWLAWLPAAMGSAWALGYFWSRRHAWDWMNDGSLLMLVSLLLAPYSWVYDDALAIPALLHGAFLTRFRPLLAALAFASLLIEVELLRGIRMSTAFYLWTAPTWLAWYFLACHSSRGGLEWPAFRARRWFRSMDSVKEPLSD